MTECANSSNRTSLSPSSSHRGLASTALALVAIFILSAFGAAPAHAALTKLTIVPVVLSFPQQEVETAAAKNVTLTNPNSTALQIDTVVPSAGDFTVGSDGCSGTMLAAGADCVVSVTFTPSQTGTRTGTLTITDGAYNSPQTVNLTGKGILDPADLSPTHLSFGEQPLDVATAADTITLTNPNLVSLSVSSVTASAPFTLTADNCSGTDVAAGGTCTFGVIFTPTQTGVAVSKVVVSDDADITPQNITVVGEGKIVTPTVSPKVLPFGKVQVDTISAPQTVTLSNSDQVPVVFSSIAILADLTRSPPIAAAARWPQIRAARFR